MQLLFASFCARQEVASGGVRVDMNKTKQTTGILIGLKEMVKSQRFINLIRKDGGYRKPVIGETLETGWIIMVSFRNIWASFEQGICETWAGSVIYNLYYSINVNVLID